MKLNFELFKVLHSLDLSVFTCCLCLLHSFTCFEQILYDCQHLSSAYSQKLVVSQFSHAKPLCSCKETRRESFVKNRSYVLSSITHEIILHCLMLQKVTCIKYYTILFQQSLPALSRILNLIFQQFTSHLNEWRVEFIQFNKIQIQVCNLFGEQKKYFAVNFYYKNPDLSA